METVYKLQYLSKMPFVFFYTYKAGGVS